ncbi:gas vesicle protein GvpG [Streptomyces carpinensis]|uniref:Gas vesicle protein GvpG n=1 Tax=Streptomyces carpinensis TaxID=66369 RepID=A0ABV1W2S1_9ACTN|nr:gas vesicle protein GvpG [Streptomyces carpinensis]
MGLLSEVVLLPLAPARASGWVIKQVLREAERVYYDPAAVRAELAQLEERLEAGEITEEEFDRQEDELLDRLEIGLRGGAGTGEGTAR